MPSIKHHSIENPASFIQSIYEYQKSIEPNQRDAASKTISAIQSEYKVVFQDAINRDQVSDFETLDIDEIKPGTLVRFQCMIQDPNFSREMQLYALELQKDQIPEKIVKFILYTDNKHGSSEGWSIVNDSYPNFVIDTEAMYCVSIPGRSSWLKQDNIESAHKSTKLSNLQTFSKLRYPMPNTNHNFAIAKFYDESPAYKVAQPVELFGIFNWDQCCIEEKSDYTWPVIHVLHSRPLDTLYPSPSLEISQDNTSQREECLRYIQSAFGGDILVATYILLLLISMSTQSNSKAGRISVGISGIPHLHPTGPSNDSLAPIIPRPCDLKSHNHTIQSILSTLESFVPAMVSIPLSLKLLNESSWNPNAENVSGLNSGILQLCSNTLVVIDESTLDEGTLTERGLRNFNSIQKMVQDQTLTYSYPFQQIEIDNYLKVLVLSCGKPLIKTDIEVPLEKESSERMKGEVKPEIDNTKIESIRLFLTAVPSLQFSIPTLVSNEISEHYANSRKLAYEKGQSLPSQTELASCLTIARLLSLSKMQTSLSLETWNEAIKLENERKSRIQNR
ncbi:hypothetical protein BB560_000747 [Smittium megazygosporum]|uniref:Mini-chromosome maintenance complex-binding protein n=1 Tax=Smittium megazygosporum TaxID=133381 RepID=A0A2T9ZJI3_9FUNG|nr:hypothetical protein BB560_000747 [Smittium megazygosporum]